MLELRSAEPELPLQLNGLEVLQRPKVCSTSYGRKHGVIGLVIMMLPGPGAYVVREKFRLYVERFPDSIDKACTFSFENEQTSTGASQSWYEVRLACRPWFFDFTVVAKLDNSASRFINETVLQDIAVEEFEIGVSRIDKGLDESMVAGTMLLWLSLVAFDLVRFVAKIAGCWGIARWRLLFGGVLLVISTMNHLR